MRKHLKNPDLCEVPGVGSGPVWADTLGNSYPELRDLFLRMLRAFSPPVDHKRKPGDKFVPLIPDTKTFYPKGFNATSHLMTPEQQQAASDLYNAVGNAIETSYQRGLRYGRSLLAQLAKGEVRISDFEQPHQLCKGCGLTLPTGNNVCPSCHANNSDGGPNPGI